MADKPKRKNWIQKAVPDKNKGKFAAKAKAAGKTTSEYASEHAGDSGTLGKEARLAQTLMGMRKKKSLTYSNSKMKD